MSTEDNNSIYVYAENEAEKAEISQEEEDAVETGPSKPIQGGESFESIKWASNPGSLGN